MDGFSGNSVIATDGFRFQFAIFDQVKYIDFLDPEIARCLADGEDIRQRLVLAFAVLDIDKERFRAQPEEDDVAEENDERWDNV